MAALFGTSFTNCWGRCQAELSQKRFETSPVSKPDRLGCVQGRFSRQPTHRAIFALTLGFSRRALFATAGRRRRIVAVYHRDRSVAEGNTQLQIIPEHGRNEDEYSLRP
jgi:hypothetical protein